MKKFIIFANCQGDALAKTLMENQEFASNYERIFLPPVQNMNTQDVSDVLSKVNNSDLFIYQPVSATPSRPQELTSSFLLRKVKPGTKVLSFPSLYFDGYFPHLQTLKGYVAVLRLVHDYFIAYACSIGLNVEDTVSLIQKEGLYKKEMSISFVENSLKKLEDRESEFDTDIKVSSFIREHYRSEKLFNQFNHPKRAVFKYVAEGILEKIGIKNIHIAQKGVSHLDAIMTPIYKSTYRNLKLQFDEDFENYNGLEQAGLKQRDVVSKFFDFYRSQNLKEIKLHIIKNKPFIPQIVEANI